MMSFGFRDSLPKLVGTVLFAPMLLGTLAGCGAATSGAAAAQYSGAQTHAPSAQASAPTVSGRAPGSRVSSISAAIDMALQVAPGAVVDIDDHDDGAVPAWEVEVRSVIGGLSGMTCTGITDGTAVVPCFVISHAISESLNRGLKKGRLW